MLKEFLNIGLRLGMLRFVVFEIRLRHNMMSNINKVSVPMVAILETSPVSEEYRQNTISY